MTTPQDIVTIEVTMIYGEESCCSKLSKCWELRDKNGGKYTEHMVIYLSRVTETAVACSSV